MSDRLNMPLERDFKFYQRRKHDKWLEVPAPAPALEGPVADSHAHIHMLPDPAWEFVRCAANGVDFVCEIVDPSEDGSLPFDQLAAWRNSAASQVSAAGLNVRSTDVRIAVGVRADGRVVFASAKCTMAELSRIMAALGCETAMNLDGGASACLRAGALTVRTPGRSMNTMIVFTID